MIRFKPTVIGAAAAALGLIAASMVVVVPAAVGKPPACAVSNARNHKGFESVQDAVDAAKAGDTVEIKGTCVGSTSVDKDITLAGIVNKAFPGPPTLDGDGQGRVITITDGTTTIRGVTITNGRTSGTGGGVYVATAAALDHVTVAGNEAGATQFGGGIEADLGSTVTLVDSTVSGNSAGSSGGIDMYRAKVTLIRSSVTGNHATRAAGAEADGCGFEGLVYSCAGGIWNYQGTLALVDSTVGGNSAVYRGGGVVTYVRVVGGSAVAGLTILSGTTSIGGNTAGDAGGGVFLSGTATSSTTGIRAADGTAAYADPVTGATLPAWTGSVSGNTPDQCSPTLTIGSAVCGS